MNIERRKEEEREEKKSVAEGQGETRPRLCLFHLPVSPPAVLIIVPSIETLPMLVTSMGSRVLLGKTKHSKA